MIGRRGLSSDSESQAAAPRTPRPQVITLSAFTSATQWNLYVPYSGGGNVWAFVGFPSIAQLQRALNPIVRGPLSPHLAQESSRTPAPPRVQSDGAGWNCARVTVTRQTQNMVPDTLAVIEGKQPGVVTYTITFGCPTQYAWHLLTPYAPSGVLNDPQSGLVASLSAQRTVLASTPLSGSFRLSYNGSLTAPLQFYAGASDIVSAIEAFTGPRSVDAYGSTTNNYDGGSWYVTLWAPYGNAPPISIVTTARISGTNTTRSTLQGSGPSGSVTVLQNGSTDALLWPIPMDYFRYASPGECRWITGWPDLPRFTRGPTICLCSPPCYGLFEWRPWSVRRHVVGVSLDVVSRVHVYVR